MDVLEKIKGRRRPFRREELAELLGVTVNTITAHKGQGWIKSYPDPEDGRRQLFAAKEVRRYIRESFGRKAVAS